MKNKQTQLAPTALIVGCGYLGKVLATKLIQLGCHVYGTTRSAQKAQTLGKLGVRPLLVSVTQPVTYAALQPALEADCLDVYYLVPPGFSQTSDHQPTARAGSGALRWRQREPSDLL